ncbi:MAG: hypothetical protein IJ871_09130 [Ruminococcus sp.]|nr:hypothetical protein [Ruminococcus sp.]
MKRFVAMVLAAITCCLMLVGCGDSKYVGKWTFEMLGTKTVLELKDDHTAKFDGTGGAKWEVDGDKIVLSDESGDDDKTLEFTIEDDETLSISMMGVSMEFKKE